MKYTIINCATNKRLTYSVHLFVNLILNHNVLQTGGSHTVQACIADLVVNHRLWCKQEAHIQCKHVLLFFLLCITPLSTIYRGGQCYWWRNPMDLEKTTDLSQVADKLYHMLYTSPWLRFELTTSVVISTDCIGSCKSNYHTITTTTAPAFTYV
jgi:hypothetical protein